MRSRIFTIMKERLRLRLVAALLIGAVMSPVPAQVPAHPSRQAAAVKRKAESLAAGARISVVRLAAEEEYGAFISCDAAGFTFHDVDTNADVSLAYSEVKKIKNGYGGYNSIVHRHTDRTKARIVLIAVAGALAGVIAAAAMASN